MIVYSSLILDCMMVDAGPRNSLACVTTDVNTQCCTDLGGEGQWYFPNGSIVLPNIHDPNRRELILLGQVVLIKFV